MSRESNILDSVKQNQPFFTKRATTKLMKLKKDAIPKFTGTNNKLTLGDQLEHDQSTSCRSDSELMKRLSPIETFSLNGNQQKTKNCEKKNENILKQKKGRPLKTRSKESRREEKDKKDKCACESTSILSLDVESKKKSKRHAKKSMSIEKHIFPNYIPEEQIDELLQSQNSSDPQYVAGHLRVNPTCHKYAYLSLPDEEKDLLILGLKDRNRAFDGDFVVACINPPENWHSTQGTIQKTGVIVSIREKIHSRKTVGRLKEHNGSVFFFPRDQKFPLIKITSKSIAKFAPYLTQSDDILYLGAVTNWIQPYFTIGVIEKAIGYIGDLKAEANAILLKHNLDVTPYSKDMIEGLPNIDNSFTENDVKAREDWRQECVFTIDPDTAKDLDDAVSCKLLENGNYEIGVHISDVTHYLEFSSPLDIQVAKRATTIYTVDNVYHMLPKQLCNVCSLLPGQDKLTFSVIWEVTPNAKIVKHRFAKTIIKSCCQMAYMQAQKLIEYPQNEWPDDMLNIYGNYTVDELSKKVNILHDLAVQLRHRRFENGALGLNQPKLHIRIDQITGLPISYFLEEQRDSNRLIEEFMLLANMTVASHLYNTIPETALLRNHREPMKRILNTTKDTLLKFGIYLDTTSSASLQHSIKRYETDFESESSDVKMRTKYRMMVIKTLCAKAMTRATYRCSSTINSMKQLGHYALNVPLYTHFTSPIRRYADCVVHRLLYATITNTELPEAWSENLCKKIAENCNTMKYNARLAQEESSKLFFAFLIGQKGPIVTIGIVLEVKENFVEVILCQVSIKLRIFFTELRKMATVKYSSECSVPTISITWRRPAVTQVLNIFTLLYLRVEKDPEKIELIGNLLPPTQDTN